jgi:hypothetical protein
VAYVCPSCNIPPSDDTDLRTGTMSDATVAPDLLRVSIGIEDHQDLLDDLLQAFREVGKLRQSDGGARQPERG